MDEMEEVLTYPCRALAKLYEPLELSDRSVDEVRRIVCGRVQELLQEFQQTHELPAVRQSAAQVVALMQTLDGEEPSYELHGIAAGTEKLLTELARADRSSDFTMRRAKKPAKMPAAKNRHKSPVCVWRGPVRRGRRCCSFIGSPRHRI